ncbi:MAG TPA: helix-turn-helix domain-containing protein [Solirubrobacteraceae bacterium]|nr:helix-turn-helix domain-containing protein [Solirubrobacteraceae bacterium]
MAVKATLENPPVPPTPGAETPTEGGRVERRKARTRAGLLAAARELFAANGVQQTTIAEIAGRADIAIGSFYNYFPTKDELLDALLAEELAKQLRRLQERQAKVTDPAEKISIAHRHLVRVTGEDANWAWLLVRLEAPYRIAWSVLGQAARSDLREGIRAGRFDVSDERLALNASAGALFAVIHARLVGELGEDADSTHAELVLRSFGLDRDEASEVAHRPLPPLAEVAGGQR